MPKTALLHIGTPKTGTTSIQRWLAHSQQHGSLAPVRYPLWKGTPHQQRLVTLYERYEDLPPTMRRIYGPNDKNYRRLREEYREFIYAQLRAATAAVISAESLSDVFSPRLAARLRADLESLGFREFRVVLYIRDPADFFLSATQQGLKSDPADFFLSATQLGPKTTTRPPFVREPASFKYDFLQMTETWEHAFPGSLVVRKYPTGFHSDVIDDFSAVLKQCLRVAPPRVSLRANATLSAEGMQILQDYRVCGGNLTPDTARVASFLSESAQLLPQTKPVLRKDVAEQIRANHRADAEVLHSRYGVDLGLQHCGPASTLPRDKPHRVDEIVESVDPEIVHQLLLLLVQHVLSSPPAKRSLAYRAAGSAYRKIHPDYRPERLVGWLRSHLLGGHSPG